MTAIQRILLSSLVIFCLSIIPVEAGILQGSSSLEPLPWEDTADQIHFSIISNTAVTFDWVGTADHIRYGIDSIDLDSIIYAEHPEFLPVNSPWVSDSGPYWEAKLIDLNVDTVYYYRIGNNGDIHRFRTPPAPGKADFRVCSTSDMHESSSECVAMFHQMAALEPSIVITTGDLTGAGPAGQQEVGQRFHDAMAWSLNAAWMPVIGNHDWEYTDEDDLRTYKGRFDIPNQQTSTSSPAVSCCGEDWGWFDYGNTRFISRPERWNSSTTWQDWGQDVKVVFNDAQNNPAIRFIVTMGHQSPYTSAEGRYGGSGTLKTILNGLVYEYPKYRLDLSGHNHQYERYSLSNGMTYIINSTAGSYYRGWDDPVKPENCNFRAIHYGLLVLDFSEDAINGRFICSVGTSQSGTWYSKLEEDVCEAPGSVLDGFTIYADSLNVVGKEVNRIEDVSFIRNHPNPFSQTTTITYSLKYRARVKIEIYDLFGRRVANVENGIREQGEYSVEWDARDERGNEMQNGIYFAEISTGHSDHVLKLLLMHE